MQIFCDGSCDYKSRLGGCGVYIVYNNNEYFISKGFRNTTISRMEGMALYLALKSINRSLNEIVTIYSDSQYIIKSFTEKRLTKWVMIDFQGIKNVDMWKAILNEINLRPLLKLNFVHIHGHQTIMNDKVFGNTVSDLLASYKIHEVYFDDNFN